MGVELSDGSPADADSVLRSAHELLTRLAFQLTHDFDAAQDLVQDAAVRFVARHGTGPIELDNPIGYLRRTLVNEFLSARRRRRVTEVVTDAVPDTAAWQPDSAVIADQRRAVWAALGALSPRHRAALVLRYYEQLSDAEIAVLLDVRQVTVRSWCRRGLAQLRKYPELSLSAVEV